VPKGKIIQNQQGYVIIYYGQNNQRTDYRVLNNNIGAFRVNDKVRFTLTGQNQATNLAAVQRRYIITGIQGSGLDTILLGIKRLTYAGTQDLLFAGGMPTVFGGDMNDGETDQQTIEREMNEEIRYAVGQNHPVLQQIHQANTKTNAGGTVTETSIFYTSPDVIPNGHVLAAATTEVAAIFRLPLDAITGALNNPRTILQQICGRAGIVIADINNLTDQQTQFLNSATLSALILLLGQHRTRRAQQGLQRAQAGLAALIVASAAYMAGFNEYTQGWQRARDGQAALVGASLAYMAGFNEYTQGLQDAGNNVPTANNNVAYIEGYRDFI